jgi:CheY-like chemotaxis protein
MQESPELFLRWLGCPGEFPSWLAEGNPANVNSSPMILVVGDDPAVLENAQRILNHDRQVLFAQDSTHALELAGNLGFSVALVDLDLPGGAGFDLIRRLRRSVPDLQIIAITNAIHSLSPEDAEKLGVVAVLRKPITPDWKPVVERIRASRTSS